jgi:hypothetical protein
VIERFIWTVHAQDRAAERGLNRFDVEAVVREGHKSRQQNRGPGDWRVNGTHPDGQIFVVIYDHPALADTGLARIVTLWRARSRAQQ